MTIEFEELDYQSTVLGDISLRRRSEPRIDHRIVYEVRLGEEFLMSSLFTVAEVELAKLALAGLDGAGLDVVVGGLGLGYTAAAALENSAIRTVAVIEYLEPVIEWHRRGLVPLGPDLTSDRRCSLVHGDFFAAAGAPGDSFKVVDPPRKMHAVLLDIDHAPDQWLASGNREFYTEAKLANLSDKIHPGGVFGMWSNTPPDERFGRLLESVFHSFEAHVVRFPNPYRDEESSATVYIARRGTV